MRSPVAVSDLARWLHCYRRGYTTAAAAAAAAALN
jgi:hypothetical protein